jgi:hypothetical protein
MTAPRSSHSLGTHQREGSEGVAYIDHAGGMWEARWYSRDEGRYVTIAKKGTRQEAIAAVLREGFKPVVISTGLEGGMDKMGDAKAVPEIMAEWKDGQPMCANYYTTGCSTELVEGSRVYKADHLLYCGKCKGPKPKAKLSGKLDKRKRPTPIWPEFVDAYLEAALWASSTGDDEDPLDDQGYSIHDFEQEAIDEAIEDSNKFIKANRKDLEAVGSQEQHGHDFWLTRNGHGAGFWDRGYGEVGKRLSDAARAYGETNAYAGDDKKIYLE